MNILNLSQGAQPCNTSEANLEGPFLNDDRFPFSKNRGAIDGSPNYIRENFLLSCCWGGNVGGGRDTCQHRCSLCLGGAFLEERCEGRKTAGFNLGFHHFQALVGRNLSFFSAAISARVVILRARVATEEYRWLWGTRSQCTSAFDGP